MDGAAIYDTMQVVGLRRMVASKRRAMITRDARCVIDGGEQHRLSGVWR